MQWLGFVNEDNTEQQQLALERDKLGMAAVKQSQDVDLQKQDIRLRAEQIELARQNLDQEVTKFTHEIGREDLNDAFRAATLGVSLVQVGNNKVGLSLIEPFMSKLGKTPDKLAPLLTSESNARTKVALAMSTHVAEAHEQGKTVSQAELRQFAQAILPDDVEALDEKVFNSLLEETLQDFREMVKLNLSEESRQGAADARAQAKETHGLKLPGLQLEADADLAVQKAIKSGDEKAYQEALQRKAELSAASNPLIAGSLTAAREDAKAPGEERARELDRTLKLYTTSLKDPELFDTGIGGQKEERFSEATELEGFLQTAFISSDKSATPEARDKANTAALALIKNTTDPQLKNKLKILYNQALDYRAIVLGKPASAGAKQ